MAVAQLGRDVEKRPDKRSMPSALRDRGQIEQDANVILSVYREEEYLKKQKPEDQFGAKYEAWRTETANATAAWRSGACPLELRKLEENA